MSQKEPCLTLEMLHEYIQRQFVPGEVHDGSVGFELEIWPFRGDSKSAATLVPLFAKDGSGLVQIIKQLEHRVTGLKWAPTASGSPRFEIGSGGQLTFEPGGQLEYSGPPKNTLDAAISDITTVIEALRCNLKSYDIWFFHSGLNPWHSLEEIGLHLNTSRYLNMDRYLQAKGPYGQRMMRQSTSLQLNVDTGEPEFMNRRWLAANLLSPIFTALFGNSPFVDGKPTGAYSFRTLIWQNLDTSRTGFPKGFLEPSYCSCPAQQYREFALNAHLLRLPDSTGQLRFQDKFLNFGEWMKEGHLGLFPDMDDWANHVSTLFPEVRVRGFLEIRYLDGQSKVWCAVPAIVLTHLLYNADACEKVIKWLMPYRTTLPGMVTVAAQKGMDEDEIARLAKRIFQLAIDSLAQAEKENVALLCEYFFKAYTHRHSNPGAELARLNNGEVFSASQYRDFEASQVENAGDLLQIICKYHESGD